MTAQYPKSLYRKGVDMTVGDPMAEQVARADGFTDYHSDLGTTMGTTIAPAPPVAGSAIKEYPKSLYCDGREAVAKDTDGEAGLRVAGYSDYAEDLARMNAPKVAPAPPVPEVQALAPAPVPIPADAPQIASEPAPAEEGWPEADEK